MHAKGLRGKWFTLNPTSSQGNAHRGAAVAARRIGTSGKSRSPSVSDALSASEHRFLSPQCQRGMVVIHLAFLLLHGRIAVHRHQTLAANTVSGNCYYLGLSDVGETGTMCKSNLLALPSGRSKGERNRWDFQKPPVLVSTATFRCLKSSCHETRQTQGQETSPGMNWLLVWKT